MKRILVAAVVMAVAAITAVAVAQTPAASGARSAPAVDIPVLRVGIVGTISTLDPARGIGIANVVRAIGFEGLARVGRDGVIRPWLARQIRHPNPNTWIYVLRRGVKFWNGNEMTAADVANALNYYRFKEFQTATYYRSVRDVKALDRYTVKVELKRPDVTFKNTPAVLSPIFEKKHADANKGEWGKPGVMPMATGPWRYVRLDPTRGMELVANDDYWGGRPSIRRISVRFFSDQTSAAIAFRAGEIDAFQLLGDPRPFDSTSGAKSIGAPSCDAGFVSMNVNQPPWNDVHVRRALAYTIDRAGLAKALGGSVTPIHQVIPPQMWNGIVPKAQVDKLYKSLPRYEYSLTKARRELAQSRYPNGFTAALPTLAGFPTITSLSQVIAGNAAKIGIRLEVKNMPAAQFIAHFYGPRDQIGIFASTSGCIYPGDPSWYPDLFLTSKNARAGGTNTADYRNAAVDALIQRGNSTESGAKRFAAYSNLLRTATRDVPYQFLFVQKYYLALNSKYTFQGGYFAGSIGQSHPWPLFIRAKS